MRKLLGAALFLNLTLPPLLTGCPTYGTPLCVKDGDLAYCDDWEPTTDAADAANDADAGDDADPDAGDDADPDAGDDLDAGADGG